MSICKQIVFRKYLFMINLSYRIIARHHENQILSLHFQNLYFPIDTRTFNSSSVLSSLKKFVEVPTKIVKRDGTILRRRSEPEKIITLIHNSEEMVLTLKEALKIAGHKGLHLMKTEKPHQKSMDFYKLVTDAELAKSSLPAKKTNHIKAYLFNTTISEHDLMIKAKTLINTLNKHKIVNFTIKNIGKDMQHNNVNTIQKKIEKVISDAGVQYEIKQKKQLGQMATFTIEVVENNNTPENTVKDSDNVIRFLSE